MRFLRSHFRRSSLVEFCGKKKTSSCTISKAIKNRHTWLIEKCVCSSGMLNCRRKRRDIGIGSKRDCLWVGLGQNLSVGYCLHCAAAAGHAADKSFNQDPYFEPGTVVSGLQNQITARRSKVKHRIREKKGKIRTKEITTMATPPLAVFL